jgi:hypothetical protein
MREATVTILVSAVAADGVLAQQEADRLDALLPSLRLFQQTSPGHVRDLTETALGLLGSHGPEVLLPACAELIPEDLRAPLFALAVELVIVDGDVGGGEMQFVDALKAALAIEDDVAAAVIDVLVMKSRA